MKKPYWKNLCKHRDYRGSFELGEGKFDVYTYDSKHWGRQICVRHGSKGGDYLSLTEEMIEELIKDNPGLTLYGIILSVIRCEPR